MGIFNRQEQREPLQIPDQLAEEAQQRYESGDFRGALIKYGEAVDKLDTMYASKKHRHPSPADAPILEGFINSLGAARRADPELDVDSEVQQAVGYLSRIANESEGATGYLYLEAVQNIQA